MSEIVLKNSGVDFNDETHEYFYFGKQLRGITGVLTNQLGWEYPNIPQAVLEKARNLGSAIHHAIEKWFKGDIVTEHRDFVNKFVKLTEKKGYIHLASEYLVTDFVNFASAIDVVFLKENGHVVLGDIKTTSKVHTEKVSWQLSIYKYFFKLLNPDLIVDELVVIWLPTKSSYGRAAIKKVDEIPESECKRLLECEITGECYKPLETPETDVVADNSLVAAMVEQFTDGIIQCTERAKAAKDELTLLNQTLKSAFEQYGVKSLKNDRLSISYVEERTQMRLDTAKLKEKYPDIYNDCLIETVVSSSLKITPKK